MGRLGDTWLRCLTLHCCGEESCLQHNVQMCNQQISGNQVNPQLCLGDFRQTVFALVISEQELQASGEQCSGRLYIHTGERWDQYHTTVVNVVRTLVYEPEGVMPNQVHVVSAGTLIYQAVADGWEVVAVLNDSGHYRPKSKSVRFVYQKLHELGHDCVRISKGTSEVLAELARREAEKEGLEFDASTDQSRAEAWLEFVTENYSEDIQEFDQRWFKQSMLLKGSCGNLHKLGRTCTKEDVVE